MPEGTQWAQEQLERLEHKRAILKALQDTLTQWEREVDWAKVPPEKQAALMALAEESVETLRSLIARLTEEIRSGLADADERVAAGDTND